ncbi:MAG: NAD(P)-dependent glycerol-3-phosphate dehydrogenase [Planctomycetes bacterium]|nr:NAD(P)-dependent glycerol-3-phosphate dehydrogenase [Planctomycetota bacterium]
MPRVSVLGNGGWGNAIAIQAIRSGNSVTIWGHDTLHLAACEATRSNAKYLPDIALPPELSFQADLEKAVADAEIALIAIPTAHLRSALAPLAKSKLAPIWLSLTKGMEAQTLAMPTQIARETLDAEEVGVLSGPNIANEVAAGLPASALVAHSKGAAQVQAALSSAQFRIYRSSDIVGAELGGVVKNVIAIAAGIIDGMGLGDNAKAALLVRGMVELQRLGVAMGASEATFAGLSGVGDLFVTCTSRFGRNRGFGERLGKGLSVEAAQDAGGKVVEGYHTARSIVTLAEKFKVEMPICAAIHDILYEGVAPRQALNDLMTRDPKAE